MVDAKSDLAQRAALEAVTTLTDYIDGEADQGMNRIDLCVMGLVFMLYTFLKTVDRNDGDSWETKKKFDEALAAVMGWGKN